MVDHLMNKMYDFFNRGGRARPSISILLGRKWLSLKSRLNEYLVTTRSCECTTFFCEDDDVTFPNKYRFGVDACRYISSKSFKSLSCTIWHSHFVRKLKVCDMWRVCLDVDVKLLRSYHARVMSMLPLKIPFYQGYHRRKRKSVLDKILSI